MLTQQKPVKVLVGDEQALIRAGIRHVLEATPNIAAISEAWDADSVYKMAREHEPDLIILDISISQGYGVTVLPLLKRDLPHAKVLIISRYNTPEYVQESLKNEVHGYVLKSCGIADVKTAIRDVLDGKKYFCSDLNDSPLLKSGAAHCCITLRERQVLSMVVSGKTNKQIAVALGISPRTVETHRGSVVRKLGVNSVAELTRYAIENGLSPIKS